MSENKVLWRIFGLLTQVTRQKCLTRTFILFKKRCWYNQNMIREFFLTFSIPYIIIRNVNTPYHTHAAVIHCIQCNRSPHEQLPAQLRIQQVKYYYVIVLCNNVWCSPSWWPERVQHMQELNIFKYIIMNLWQCICWIKKFGRYRFKRGPDPRLSKLSI
jgi:hypothetical protein